MEVLPGVSNTVLVLGDSNSSSSLGLGCLDTCESEQVPCPQKLAQDGVQGLGLMHKLWLRAPGWGDAGSEIIALVKCIQIPQFQDSL